jgi:hypothetical protein
MTLTSGRGTASRIARLVGFIGAVYSVEPAPADQLTKWIMPPNIVDFTTLSQPTVHTLPGTPASSYFVANGMYDRNGQLLFYVAAEASSGSYSVRDRNGDFMAGSGLSGPDLNGEISVVPVPGDCSRMFLIHSRSQGFSGVDLYYSVLDLSANGGLGAVGPSILLATVNSGNTVAIAVSQLRSPSNSVRFLYVVSRVSVDRYLLSATGIVFDTTIVTLTSIFNLYVEAELSHDGRQLAWTEQNGATATVVSLDAAGGYNGTTTTFSLPTNEAGGLEFSPDGTKLYVAGWNILPSTTDGIYSIPMPNGPIGTSPITGSGPYGESQLELAPDGSIYASSASDLGALTNPNSSNPVFLPAHVPGAVGGKQGQGSIRTLPDQIDGEDYEPVICSGCIRPPADLVGWWPFDELAGPPHDMASQIITTAQPAFGGTGPVPVAGRVLGALSFDGVNDYVQAAGGSAVQFVDEDFSIDAWVKTGVGNGIQPIVDKRLVAGWVNGYRMYLDDGYLAATLATREDPGQVDFVSGPPTAYVADNQWHHVAAVFGRQGPNPGVRLYVDGVRVAAFAPAKPGRIFNGTAPLLIGRSANLGGPLAYFQGQIDEVEIFRRALTSADVQSLYAARYAGKCKVWCYANRYQCVGQSAGTITFTIYNGTPTAQNIPWSIVNGGADSAVCTVNTGAIFTPTGQTASVPAFGFTTVTVSVVPPPLTSTDVACYTITINHPILGTYACEGGMNLCCQPPWCWQALQAFQSVPTGTGAPTTFAQFVLENTAGAPGSLAYRLIARSTNPADPTPHISLDGLPAGSPITGVANLVAGAQRELSVRVAYASYCAFAPETLDLEVDPENDGVYTAATGMGLIAVPHICPDEFVEDFESYSLGPVCGQGGWEEWAGSTDVCGVVTNEHAFGGSRSFKIVGNIGGSAGLGDDTVHPFDISGGHHVISVMTYVPIAAQGVGWVVLLDSYPTPFNWSMNLQLDANADVVRDVDLGATTPVVRGLWIPLEIDIDLDADSVNCTYDGEQFVTGKSWTNGSGQPGLPRIQAIDLYGGEPNQGGTTGMFFDDLVVRQVCESLPCIGDLNGDNVVDISDLAQLLANFGGPGGGADGDIDGDGDVDLTDLANLLSNFGLTC